MKKTRQYYDLNGCLIISNFKRMEEKKAPIVSKLDLAVKLFEVAGVKAAYLNYKALYYKIKRREVDGFYTEDVALTEFICEFLGVKKEDLIK